MDAAVAAQAALAVVAPQACGVGGDAIVLVRDPQGRVISFHGAGRWSEAAGGLTVGDDGSSVTVPGAAHAWSLLIERYGRRSLAQDLAPAVSLAERGFAPDPSLLEGIEESRPRLERGGAGAWSLVASSADRRDRSSAGAGADAPRDRGGRPGRVLSRGTRRRDDPGGPRPRRSADAGGPRLPRDVGG